MQITRTRFRALMAPVRCTAFMLLGCLSAGAALADEVVEQNRDVSDFDGVVFSGTGDLFITQGDSEFLTIHAEQKVLDVITTRVADGVLHIGRKKGTSVRSREDIRFDLGVRNLERLGMAGSGDAFSSHLEGDTLKITISGSSDVELEEVLVDELRVTISGSGELDIADLDANHLDAGISGSGTITVAGRSASQDITVSGSGDHLAADLATETVTATVVGSGKVEVWASESLDVTVTGSGDVVYRGKPAVSMQVMGSGKVEAMGKLF